MPERAEYDKSLDAYDWCHIFDGQVHNATLTDGVLTTYNIHDEEHDCFRQTTLEPDQIRVIDGSLRLWRDRESYEEPVCPRCEATFDETQDVLEAFRDDYSPDWGDDDEDEYEDE